MLYFPDSKGAVNYNKSFLAVCVGVGGWGGNSRVTVHVDHEGHLSSVPN